VAVPAWIIIKDAETELQIGKNNDTKLKVCKAKLNRMGLSDIVERGQLKMAQMKIPGISADDVEWNEKWFVYKPNWTTISRAKMEVSKWIQQWLNLQWMKNWVTLTREWSIK
jgi:3-deoxy-D-manno-octulosonic-acid transferase